MTEAFYVCAYLAMVVLSIKALRWIVADDEFRDSDFAPMVIFLAMMWPVTVPVFALGRLMWMAATWKPKKKPDPVKRIDHALEILEDMKRQVDQIGL